MRKTITLVLLVIVGSLAGFGFLGGESTQTEPTESETKITAPTGDIVLKESQLPDPYTQRFNDRKLQNESNRTTMKEHGMVVDHMSSFGTDNETLPRSVRSFVTLFENSSAADTWFTSNLNRLRNKSNATVEQLTMAGGIQVTLVTYELDNDGNRGTSMYRKTGSYMYLTSVVGNEYHQSLTRELFVNMLDAAEG